MEGSEPQGSGPFARRELETARRELYRRSATQGAVDDYRSLVAEAEAAAEAGRIAETTASRPVVDGTPSRGLLLPQTARLPLLRLLAIAILGTAVVAVLAFPPPPPDTVPVPVATGGTTLVAYSRGHVDGTGPGIISYQPEGYSVFRAEGRALRVDLTCAGEGTVLISAGRRFRFECGRSTASFSQVDRRVVRDPFVVMGTTTGDVVWSVRISAVPLAARVRS